MSVAYPRLTFVHALNKMLSATLPVPGPVSSPRESQASEPLWAWALSASPESSRDGGMAGRTNRPGEAAASLCAPGAVRSAWRAVRGPVLEGAPLTDWAAFLE